MTSLDSSSPTSPFNVPSQHLLWVAFCHWFFYMIRSMRFDTAYFTEN